ncbi:unnamed protein product, partial [Effrenium voratum]
EEKLRPIDDALECQLNSAFTASIHLQLQDTDFITAMSLDVSKRVCSGRQRSGSGQWVGKCLDLSKAYKQLPIYPPHRDLAVIFYKSPEGHAVFHVANSLIFGSSAAVFAFNRISRSLRFLLCKELMIPSSVFYDDFPLLSPAESSREADESASALFDLLGWRHAKTGPKAPSFQPEFVVLGMRLDLSRLHEGVITLSNKPGRVERLCALLEDIARQGKVTKQEAQSVHGLLRYASGHFAGRQLGLEGSPNPTKLKNVCSKAVSLLQKGKPRVIPAQLDERPVIVFTDGSWENHQGGMGAVVVDMATGAGHVLEGTVPLELASFWSETVGEQAICEVELLAVVALREVMGAAWLNRRVIIWIDNESARFGLIKGISRSGAMQSLLHQYCELETRWPCFQWIERVPSASNPSDGPSRFAAEEACRWVGLDRPESFVVPDRLIKALVEGPGLESKGKVTAS